MASGCGLPHDRKLKKKCTLMFSIASMISCWCISTLAPSGLCGFAEEGKHLEDCMRLYEETLKIIKP